MLYERETPMASRRMPSILDIHKEEIERKERLRKPTNKTFPQDKIDAALSILFGNKACVLHLKHKK